jgi:hypothetical protein
MDELLELDETPLIEVRQSKMNLPPLSQKEIYYNRLLRFTPQYLNAKDWESNAIITNNPTCMVSRDGNGFKVTYKSRVYVKRTIDEVVKCIEGIKSVIENSKIPHNL